MNNLNVLTTKNKKTKSEIAILRLGAGVTHEFFNSELGGFVRTSRFLRANSC